MCCPLNGESHSRQKWTWTCFLTLALCFTYWKDAEYPRLTMIRGWAIDGNCILQLCMGCEWTQFCNIKTAGSSFFFLHSGSPVFWPPFWCQRLKPLLLYLEYPAIVFLLGSIFNYNIMLSYYLNFKNIWVIWIGNIMVLGMEKPWNNPLSWKILEHGFQS